jgi:hypothetical protein
MGLRRVGFVPDARPDLGIGLLVVTAPDWPVLADRKDHHEHPIDYGHASN